MSQGLGRLREYRLLEKLGEGGMGAVFKAIHERLQKTVAIKVLPPDRTNDRAAIARFYREMQAIGRLDHANVVRATDAGEENGIHFLVMEYVQGQTLAQLLQRHGRLPTGQACELVRQAALGLHHIQSAGLVHRDIKPSNLIVTPTGQLKILDLGLAQLRQPGLGDSALTASGSFMGTVDYVAPEQLVNASGVDIRADVYSLGCTLYQLLSGRVPFAGAAPLQKLAAHQMLEPEPLERLRSELPPPLVQIVKVMMIKQPAQRPLPHAVVHWLTPYCTPLSTEVQTGSQASKTANQAEVPTTSYAGSGTQIAQPIPEPIPEKRGPGRLLALGSGGVVVVVAVIVALVMSKPKPETGVGPAVAGGSSEPTRPAPTSPTRQNPLVSQPNEPPGPVIPVSLHAYTPISLAFSPDSKRVLSCSAWELILWDVERRKQIKKWSGVYTLAGFSPDGRFLVWSDGSKLNWTEAETFKDEGSIESTGIYCFRFSADGKRVIVGDSRGTARVWDVASKKTLLTHSQQPAITCADLSPDGKFAILGDARGALSLWNLEKDRIDRVFGPHAGFPRQVLFTPDGTRLWSLAGTWQPANDTTARLWEVATGKELKKIDLKGQETYIYAGCLTPDLKRAVIGYSRGKSSVWALETGRELRTDQKHNGSVVVCAVSRDGFWALTAGEDHTIWIHRLPLDDEVKPSTEGKGPN